MKKLLKLASYLILIFWGKLQILTPERYNEHPCHFYMGVNPPPPSPSDVQKRSLHFR